ncbi:MAG: class I SAM-dependent methyltransferase family protein [Candidatus Methanosuratincola petrocarbonis]
MRKSAVLEAVEGLVEGEDLRRALKGVDIIGRIAVIKIPREWEGIRHLVGERILATLGVDSVYRQTAPARQGDRVRGLEWLAGKRSTETVYSEHGCKFFVDISKVYFSPRLSNERRRIADLVAKGETVVNMFAGVGTFSIIIAKSKGAKVYSIDNNPNAFELMIENVAQNRLNGRVVPILADAREAAAELQRSAERILMPLPELAEVYLEDAVRMLRGKGWIHVYTHECGGNEGMAVEGAKTRILKSAEMFAEVIRCEGKVVRSIGRRSYQVVLDMLVMPH